MQEALSVAAAEPWRGCEKVRRALLGDPLQNLSALKILASLRAVRSLRQRLQGAKVPRCQGAKVPGSLQE
ncbi:hypothetical protein DWF74_19575 [Pseudomonas protegens]|nr:hypothetical protein DWF74_19575 [Pseudomonas protegens]